MAYMRAYRFMNKYGYQVSHYYVIVEDIYVICTLLKVLIEAARILYFLANYFIAMKISQFIKVIR